MLLKVHSKNIFQKQTNKNPQKSNWTGQRTQGGAERAFVKAGKRVEEAWICVKEQKETGL